MGYILFLVLSNFNLLTGFEEFSTNLILGGLTLIIGVIGFIAAVVLDKKGVLTDPVSIEVE